MVNESIPAKLFLPPNEIETGAAEQIGNLCRLPFAHSHIAIMPDVHQGYGMPIGGVMAAKGVVVPNAVGVDIGCGVACCRLPPHIKPGRGELNEITDCIYNDVPLGTNRHSSPLLSLTDFIDRMPRGFDPPDQVAEQPEKANLQLGTLGGGNHFIEIQKDDDGRAYVMIHSGSRNLGHAVATKHNLIARELCYLWGQTLPLSLDMAYLPVGTREGQKYLNDMHFCVLYARLNRELLMRQVLGIINEILAPGWSGFNAAAETTDIAHNYAAVEYHYGEHVYVHRKGATPAFRGQYGLIPGCQGSHSYIVRGLGNPESFMSCSHGAGRVFSRTAARKNLDLATEQTRLNDTGVIHRMNSSNKLDEAPGAYKDIEVVMERQKSLVEIVTRLTPIAVIKG
jgi:tRNA-splicing ligase RtcB